MTHSTAVAQPPRVLISYRHESHEHAERVRALSDQLRRDGVDAVIDRYVPAPSEGWSWWMEGELKKADRVIVVCSEGYRASASREAEKGQGHGTSWEWYLIRKEFYDSRGAGERITPVFFNGDDERHVPSEAWDPPGYCLTALSNDDYRQLLNDLFRRPVTALRAWARAFVKMHHLAYTSHTRTTQKSTKHGWLNSLSGSITMVWISHSTIGSWSLGRTSGSS